MQAEKGHGKAQNEVDLFRKFQLFNGLFKDLKFFRAHTVRSSKLRSERRKGGGLLQVNLLRAQLAARIERIPIPPPNSRTVLPLIHFSALRSTRVYASSHEGS